MHRIHVRAAFAALALVSGVLLPAAVEAQMTPMFTAFGAHGANSNLVTQPLGVADCNTDIPFTFSPVTPSSTTRYIDVWSASSSSAMCQMGTTVRGVSTNLACSYVGSYPYVATSMSAIPSGITPQMLFGTCETATRTFYFFDVPSMHNTSDNFTSYWLITAQLSATPPSAPVIAGTPAGDEVIQVTWNASSFTALGTTGQVYLYAVSGCAGTTIDANGVDAGTSTSSLMGGGTAPSTHLLATSAASPINLNTSLLGWSTAAYGEMDSVAIATVDSAGNTSPLSNVVCVQHVLVTGFWEQYCAEHGMPDIAQCTANYHGCSVGAPGPRTDLSAVAFGLSVLGLLGARRRRRSR